MKHSEAELSARWGTKIPAHEQNNFALDIKRPSADQLVRLPEGAADLPLPNDPSGMTAKTRANCGELHCPAPDCGPFATTVGGAKRHHFRHRPDSDGNRPGHDPETKAHFAAKHAIAQWIRATAGDRITRLDVDQFMVEVTVGPNVEPDVYVELDTGAKIAVEYQHSTGKAKDVLHKTQVYKDHGITAWWLYGPDPATCKVVARPPGQRIQVKLTNNQHELARLGASFFWFDATCDRIGTPMVFLRRFIDRHPDERWETPSPQTTRRYAHRPFTAKLRTARLDDCALEQCAVNIEDGTLITPGTRAIRRDEVKAQAEITALRDAARARSTVEQERRVAGAAAQRAQAEDREAQEARETEEAAEADALAQADAESVFAMAPWAVAEQECRDLEMAQAAGLGCSTDHWVGVDAGAREVHPAEEAAGAIDHEAGSFTLGPVLVPSSAVLSSDEAVSVSWIRRARAWLSRSV